MSYKHREAFCLMKYATDDGSETETLWNSRDGVTPFGITSQGGKEMHHVEWQSDVCRPDFVPPTGMRIFVDATLELVTPKLEEYIENIFKNHNAKDAFGTRPNAFKRLLPSWLRDGSPWIVTAPYDREAIAQAFQKERT